MAYCKNCGAYIPQNDDECPACGAKTTGPAASGAAKAEEPKKNKYRQGNTGQSSGEYKTGTTGEYRYTYNNGRRTEPKGPSQYAAEYDSDAEENKSVGLLCYLGPLLLIPLLTKPDSQFLRYHCNQGLLLAIFCILANVCFSIPFIGWIAGIAGWCISIGSFFKGIKNVREGKRRPLPFFGDITLIK